MERSSFDLDFYLSMLRTADAVKMAVVTEDDLIMALAILHVAGNNEMMTHSYKFMGDVLFAQEKFHIRGGERPDIWIVAKLRKKIAELEDYLEDNDDYPAWARDFMMKRYGIKLFN